MSDEIREIKKASGKYQKWALEARKKYIELRLRQDPEIRAVYTRAVKRIAQELKKYSNTSSPPRLQMRLQELQKSILLESTRLSEDYRRLLEKYISEAVEVGTSYSRQVLIDLFDEANIDLQTSTMFARANIQAVEACWARTSNGLQLSNRIWRQGENFKRNITNIIQQGVALGNDVVKVAEFLEQYVQEGASTTVGDYPNMLNRMTGRVPSSLSYEALRLARTEMTAAYGEGTIVAASVTPSYVGIKWVLSLSHPVEDICDVYATHDEGLGKGVYRKGTEPIFPAHPNCLCHLVPVHEDTDDFVKRLIHWNKNPQSQPDLESWYQTIYKPMNAPSSSNGSTIYSPSFLRVNKVDYEYDDSADRQQINEDLSLLPLVHRELLLREGVTLQTGYGISAYDRKNKVIRVGKEPIAGEIIHEVGHFIETYFDLFNQPDFIAVLRDGIPDDSYDYIVESFDFDVPIKLIDNPLITKFISIYQSRVYPEDLNGEGWLDYSDSTIRFNVLCLGEYFTEGYRCFIQTPQMLKEKDPMLYDFIKKIGD